MRRRWAVLVVALVGAWGLAIAITLWGGAMDLRAARDSLTRAGQSLRESDLSAARQDLSVGGDAAARASTALGRPWLMPLDLLPVAGDNVDAARVLAAAARDLSVSAGAVLDMASEIVHANEQVASRGQVPLGGLERVAQPLAALESTMEDTVARVDGLACEGLLGPVRRACRRFTEIAGPAVGHVRAGAAMARVAPSMLGRDRPRRYLVFAASYSELRGSMGLLGSWALMTADDGRLDVGPFRETAALPVADPGVAAPSADFARRYARYGVLQDWRNANMSPSFPDTARVLLELWDAGGGAPVDGVLVTSPVVVEAMVGHLGPLEVPGVTTLTADNVRTFIGLDAYAAFDSQQQRKRVLGAVATAGFERMLDVVESSDVMASAEMLQRLVAEGHVRMYVRDDDTQRVLAEMGVAGRLPAGDGEFAWVVVNNVAGNKLDFFTTRRVHHTVRLLPDGVTASELEVTFRNDAPTSGHPRYVVGPASALLDAGDNLSLVSFYCGRTCAMEGRPKGVRDGGREGQLPVWDLAVRIPAGVERRVAYRTRTTDGWYREGHQVVVPVRHLVQPGLHATPLQLRVEAPEGWSPVEVPEGAEVSEAAVVVNATGTHDLDLVVRFEPTPAGATPDDADIARR